MKGVVSFPSTKWDRQGLRQRSSPPCYLPTPFPGVGGERSETEGGGWMGHSAARVQRVAVAASPQVFYNAAFGGPLHHFVVPLPPDERWEASLKGVVSFPPQNGIGRV